MVSCLEAVEKVFHESIWALAQFKERFFLSASMDVAHEISLLVEEIQRLGSKSEFRRSSCAAA